MTENTHSEHSNGIQHPYSMTTEVGEGGGIHIENTQKNTIKSTFDVLERFNRAIERKKKIPVTVRYDADIVDWFQRQGRGYQSRMNAALRAFMEIQQQAEANGK